jgi:hypothetical protein
MKFTKESARRALRTFIQAFLGVFAANVTYLSTLDWELDTKTIVITIVAQVVAPALSAGLAALMNMEEAENG